MNYSLYDIRVLTENARQVHTIRLPSPMSRQAALLHLRRYLDSEEFLSESIYAGAHIKRVTVAERAERSK